MTGKAQAGQENFKLTLVTGIDFTQNNPSEMAIQYQRAIAGDGPQEWTAAKVTGLEKEGHIFHDFDDTDPVPAKGIYQVRARLVIDGKTVYTQPVEWEVGGW